MGSNRIKITLSFLFSLVSTIGPQLVIAETKVRKNESCKLSRATPVLEALEKAVFFYKEYGEDLNLDAYFGLRIAEGTLYELIRQKKTVKALMKSCILKQVVQLQTLVSQIGSKSMTSLRRRDMHYFKMVGYTVSQPWFTVKKYRKIDPKLTTPFDNNELSDDILHDYEPCLARLLGSPLYGSRPCDVPKECLEVMMRPGEVGYVLTHQALYFMFGEQRGCLYVFSRKIEEYKSSLEKVYDKICSNIYTQLLLVEQVRPFKRVDADLMMEQSVVCGLLGYYEFLTPHRLANIKRWQRPNGCYGDIVNEEELNRKMGWKTMRKLLMGKELSDGCESHITGVGTALLSIYLRFVIDEELLIVNSTKASNF